MTDETKPTTGQRLPEWETIMIVRQKDDRVGASVYFRGVERPAPLGTTDFDSQEIPLPDALRIILVDVSARANVAELEAANARSALEHATQEIETFRKECNDKLAEAATEVENAREIVKHCQSEIERLRTERGRTEPGMAQAHTPTAEPQTFFQPGFVQKAPSMPQQKRSFWKFW